MAPTSLRVLTPLITQDYAVGTGRVKVTFDFVVRTFAHRVGDTGLEGPQKPVLRFSTGFDQSDKRNSCRCLLIPPGPRELPAVSAADPMHDQLQDSPLRSPEEQLTNSSPTRANVPENTREKGDFCFYPQYLRLLPERLFYRFVRLIL